MAIRGNRFKKIKAFAFILAVFAVSLTVNHFVSGWTEPAVTPPGGNAPAPVNVSSDAQIKAGDLSVTTLYDTNDSNYYIDLDAPAGIGGVFGGKVGIGTTNPGATLQIGGPATNSFPRPLYVQGDSDDRYTAAFANTAGYGVVAGANETDTFGNIEASHFVNGGGDGALIPLVINRHGGNVGIGTTDPNSKLYVRKDNLNINWGSDVADRPGLSGTVKVEGIDTEINLIGQDETFGESALKMAEVNAASNYTNLWAIWRSATTGGGGKFGISYITKAEGDAGAGYWHGAQTKFTILPSGNVGIGTTTPGQKLEVNGKVKVGNDAIAASTGTIRYNSAVNDFEGYVGGAVPAWKSLTNGGSLPAGVSGQTLRHDGTNWIANSALYNNGTQVGIGTTSPFADSTLHIYKSSGWAEERIQSTDAAGGADTHYINNAGTNFSVGVDGTGNSGNFRIEQWASGDWQPRLVINPSGRVGIGRWDPSAMMDVQMSAGNETEGIHISRTANMNFSYLSISDEAFNTVFRVHENSNVGIGVWVPGEKLDVNGNVRALAFLYSSDERLKENIRKLDNPLEKIMELDGVSFDWKYSGERGIGVTAQNVETVFPELVKTDKASGMKSVEYGNLIAPLIEAMKEQQKMIEKQKKEIEILKAIISK